MIRALALLCVGVVFTGCGRSVPTKAEVDDAKAKVEAAVEASQHVRIALELLGVLPTYTCGEPRRTFVGRAADGFVAQHACGRVINEPVSDTSDAIVLHLDGEGCVLAGHTVSGSARFRYSGGEDRMELEADLEDLFVDGRPLSATAGYGVCGDEKSVWATAQSSLPEHPDVVFTVDGKVALRDGLPVIGGTSVIVDGDAAVTSTPGTDRVSFTALHYEVGEYFPKSGVLEVETSSGHRLRATFEEKLWRLGEAELVIDSHDPVTVPLVR